MDDGSDTGYSSADSDDLMIPPPPPPAPIQIPTSEQAQPENPEATENQLESRHQSENLPFHYSTETESQTHQEDSETGDRSETQYETGNQNESDPRDQIGTQTAYSRDHTKSTGLIKPEKPHIRITTKNTISSNLADGSSSKSPSSSRVRTSGEEWPHGLYTPLSEGRMTEDERRIRDQIATYRKGPSTDQNSPESGPSSGF